MQPHHLHRKCGDQHNNRWQNMRERASQSTLVSCYETALQVAASPPAVCRSTPLCRPNAATGHDSKRMNTVRSICELGAWALHDLAGTRVCTVLQAALAARRVTDNANAVSTRRAYSHATYPHHTYSCACTSQRCSAASRQLCRKATTTFACARQTGTQFRPAGCAC